MAVRRSFRNQGFQSIKLGVAAADHSQISPLKGDEFGTASCQHQLCLGKFGLKMAKFLSLTVKFLRLRRTKLGNLSLGPGA